MKSCNRANSGTVFAAAAATNCSNMRICPLKLLLA